jgi:hypothetical protein
MSDTLLTRSVVSIESRPWAHQPVVVERLDNRDALLLTGFVDGGRHHGKSIVNMNQIWFEILENTADSDLAVAR